MSRPSPVEARLASALAWTLAMAVPAAVPAAEAPSARGVPDGSPYADDDSEPIRATQPPASPAPTAPPAAGGDPVAECVQAFGAAQKLRRAGKLLASSRELTRCAQPLCPTILADRCARWYREVRDALPAIVVAARDTAGRDTIRVRLLVDGRLVRRYLDGRAIELDPGMHVLRLEYDGAPPVRRMLVLTEGEGVRRVEVDFSRPEPSPTGAVPSPRTAAAGGPEPPWPVVIAGFVVGGAGLGVGTITGAIALEERANIAAECPENHCPADQRDAYQRATALARVSTLGFITAGGATTLSVLTLLLAGSSPGSEPTARGDWSLRPSVAAGSLGLSGTFP